MPAPAIANLEYTREDNHPISFQLIDEDGVAVDISTGFTFTMSVADADDADDPGTAVLFALAGAVTDGPNGVVQFTPSSVQSDLVADVYFYDVQQDTPTRRTIAKGQIEILTQVTLA